MQKMMVLDFLHTNVGIHYDPRIFQHTPGTYPRPRTNSLSRNSFHLGVWGGLGMLQGYVGVLLDMKKRPLDLLPGDVFFSLPP